jgi:hypothetical protein
MKYLIFGFTVLGLLAAAPVRAASLVEGLCRGTLEFTRPLTGSISLITSEDYSGPLCFKVCKGAHRTCTGASASLRKCRTTVAKSITKRDTAACQLEGVPKKTCTGNARTSLKARLKSDKDEFRANKEDCSSLHDECKVACTLP